MDSLAINVATGVVAGIITYALLYGLKEHVVPYLITLTSDHVNADVCAAYKKL